MVNGKVYPWEEELTVQIILDKMKFTFPLMIVDINGKVVPKVEYTCTVIQDGDDIKAIHLICGG